MKEGREKKRRKIKHELGKWKKKERRGERVREREKKSLKDKGLRKSKHVQMMPLDKVKKATSCVSF